MRDRPCTLIDPTSAVSRRSASRFRAMMLLLLATATPLPAQDSLLAGTRARVTTRALTPERHMARVIALPRDSIVLMLERDSSFHTLPRTAVTRLEVGRGRKSNIGRYSLRAAAAGALVGAVAGVATPVDSVSCVTTPDRERQCRPTNGLSSRTGNMVGGAIYLSLPAAFLGAVAGLVVWTERWEQVPMFGFASRVRISPTADRGVAIGVRF